MAYRSLRHFIRTLEAEGELIRVTAEVSPVLEISEIADRMVKAGGKALLFENTGTGFPLLINAMASDRRICLALGIKDLSEIGPELADLLREFTGPREGILEKLKLIPALRQVASWMPASSRGRGACQEVVMDPPDLGQFPIMQCWPADGGRFITLPCVHTVDPDTGIRNVGMYRMQVFGSDLTGMHWHLHKDSARHFRRYRELGVRMPVAVTLGGDPACTYSATAPLPENLDEYLLAGFLRKKRVELVKCLTNRLEVPADADIVIEGYVDPAEEPILEGPFGDHTGFYSLADYYPRFHVTCITHRKDAVYPSTLVGIPPQEDAWIGKATEKIFLLPIRMTVVPELTDMHMPAEGVFHNLAIVSARKHFPGQAAKIMSALWGAGQMMFNKVMAVTDSDVPPADYLAVARAVSLYADPVHDIHFIRGPVDILDHASSSFAYGSKMGIDATRKLGGEMTERDERPAPANPPTGGYLPGMVGICERYLQMGISIRVVSLSKQASTSVRIMATEMLNTGLCGEAKFILFIDEWVAPDDPAMVVWIAANNIDPVRDCFHIQDPRGKKFPVLFIDATVKTLASDHFSRDWPNVTLMDEETIRRVDGMWPALGLGPRVPSPSDRFKSLNINEGAIRTADSK